MKSKIIIFSVIWLLVIVPILHLIGFIPCIGPTYSESERVGYIIKFGKKGTIYKTLEGELYTGVPAGTTGIMIPSFQFTIHKSKAYLAKDIQNAIDNNLKVKIFYEQASFSSPIEGETSYFVTKIEPIKIK
jgi:uncharacterized protein YqjF (DUF2071 family)